MADRDEMRGSSNGEYRFILETRIQYFGRKPEDHFGERQPMVGQFVTTWIGARSFFPPRDIRELRDLTRRRRTLVGEGAAERNRVQKSPSEIAELGHWSLAPKIPQIIEALEGHRMSDHHRFLIRQSLRHMRYIEEMIEELDKEIAVRLKPYQQPLKLACTVPRIKPNSAASILAETGMDMRPEGPFPDCHHLAS
jgi:transposase